MQSALDFASDAAEPASPFPPAPRCHRAPVLVTERLRLRPFREDDLDAFAAMCADAEVMRYIGTGAPVARDVAWRQMAMLNGEWSLRGYGHWAIERLVDGVLIGRAGFLHPEGWPACELGWLLAREAWGRGYAVEAAREALSQRVTLGVPGGLISLIRPDNAPSVRLAERLGATEREEIDFLGGRCKVFAHPDAR